MKLSQEVVAERAGISPTTLTRFETGKDDKDFKTIEAILGALDCTLALRCYADAVPLPVAGDPLSDAPPRRKKGAASE